MATDYASAVRHATMAAARLHQQLGLRGEIEAEGGNVDVFKFILKVGLPLLLKPLQGLLGAYLSGPAPGALVTTQRPMSIQRFTAAHELGHFLLGHEPSLDDENILRRMSLHYGNDFRKADDFQEDEANAFAVALMMPQWLITSHARRQGWTVSDFREPSAVYQLALRLGASYEAVCWTMVRYRLVDESLARELLETKPRTLKAALLDPFHPQDYRGDVWLLTERDAGKRIDGSRNDLFVLRLREHSGAGYLWDIDELRASGFAIVHDVIEAADPLGIGSPVMRCITAAPPDNRRGSIALNERRPWEPEPPLSSITVDFDLTGPEEEGLSRVERRSLLEAA